MNWYKSARTYKIDPEDEHIDAGRAEILFRQNNINYGRDKDISHIAIEDGRIIGSVASGWSLDSSMDEKVIVYSFDLVVSPDHRRRGVGKKLIDDAVREYEENKEEQKESHGADHAMMKLWVINPSIVPYLESIGFDIESKYKDGSAHLVRF